MWEYEARARNVEHDIPIKSDVYYFENGNQATIFGDIFFCLN